MTDASSTISGSSGKAKLFLPRYRGLQIAVGIVTFGLGFLALLSVWLWRRQHRRWATASGAMVAFVATVVIVAIATGPKPKASASGAQTTTTASNPSPVTSHGNTAADTAAKSAVGRALVVIASQYQDFGDFSLVTPKILGNLDHRLRRVATLAASSTRKTFEVSVRSASGVTFTVIGDGLLLTRTCTPTGPGCADGHWVGADRLKLPKVPVVTAAQKTKIRAILTDNVDHYAQMLALGQRVLGTTQYASATDGLTAFNDPNSAASRFSAYRKNPNPESDLSYENAFQKADSYFTAANEPAAISTWRDDMIVMTGDFDQWVNVAVGWQIEEHSTAQLQAAAQTVQRALTKARGDIDRVVAGR